MTEYDDDPALAPTDAESASRILTAVVHAAGRLLEAATWRDGMDEVLERLGTAADVSRAYIFQNHEGPDQELRTTQLHEWVAPGIAPQIASPQLTDISYVGAGFGAWIAHLDAGRAVMESRDGPADGIRELMAAQDIRSMAIVPIRPRGRWWGFIGFDDCIRERVWAGAETQALQAAAGLVGSAIVGDIAEHKLRTAEARYRALVEQIRAVSHVSQLDEAATTIYISPQVEEMLGYPLQQWYEQPDLWMHVLHPEDEAEILEANRRLYEEGQPFSRDYRMMTADGREVWIREETDVVRDDRGMPLYSQGVLLDITDRKQTEVQLQETVELLRRVTDERQHLFAHLTRAEEEARAQVAADIHDDPLQKVTAVGLRLGILRERLEDAGLRDEMAKLEGQVGAAVRSLRSLLFQVYPLSLERFGVTRALRDLLEEVGPASGLEWDLDDDLGMRPPLEVETTCYRIAQEALSNVQAHAGASKVHLTVEVSQGGLRTAIEDDGTGFDPEAASGDPGHLGLAAMRERAELAGGWLRIESSPGHGTSVEFWLPTP